MPQHPRVRWPSGSGSQGNGVFLLAGWLAGVLSRGGAAAQPPVAAAVRPERPLGCIAACLARPCPCPRAAGPPVWSLLRAAPGLSGEPDLPARRACAWSAAYRLQNVWPARACPLLAPDATTPHTHRNPALSLHLSGFFGADDLLGMNATELNNMLMMDPAASF